MADIKKLIKQELDNSFEEKMEHWRVNQASRDKEEQNKAKAEKIMTFIEPVLREFANQTEKKVRRIKNKNYSGWVDCIARYEIYIPNFIGLQKADTYSLEVAVGLISGSPLQISSGEYGRNTPLEEVNEEWLIKALMREYKGRRWSKWHT